MILPFWLRQLLGSPLTRCNLGYPHLPEIGKRASCELLHRTVLANLKASLWPVWKLLTESSQTKTGPLQTWLNPNMQMNANQHNPPAKVHLNSSKAKCFFLMPRILNFPVCFLSFFLLPLSVFLCALLDQLTKALAESHRFVHFQWVGFYYYYYLKCILRNKVEYKTGVAPLYSVH